jgi:hypothetical protein
LVLGLKPRDFEGVRNAEPVVVERGLDGGDQVGELQPAADIRAALSDFRRDGLDCVEGQLSREATEEERRIAFTYDLSCVTRFRGCQGRCEIAPLLWKAVYQKSLKYGWAMPPEETNDPHCKVAEREH